VSLRIKYPLLSNKNGLQDLINTGASVLSVAMLVGCELSSVYVAIKRLGIELPKNENNKITDVEAAKVLVSQGYSRIEIAKKLGVSPSVAYKTLRATPGSKYPLVQDKEYLKVEVDRGRTIKEIAEDIGYPRKLIEKRIREYALIDRRIPKLNDRDFLQESIDAGATIKGLSIEFGCSTTRVRNALSCLSVQVNRPSLTSRAGELQGALESSKSLQEAADKLGYSKIHLSVVSRKLGLLTGKNTSVSDIEKELRVALEFTPSEVLYNSKCIGGQSELDIYFPTKGIGIEMDGVYWHSEDQHEDKHNILHKWEKARDAGIRSIHILDVEWTHNREACVNILTAALSDSIQKIPARKCELREVPTKESRPFLDKYHMQGFVRSSICVGLYHENELVGLMSFGATRYSKKVTHELLRLSFKTGIAVTGGSARLLKYAQSLLPMESIVSYCDKRLFSGAGYERLGFKLSHTSAPNYYYVKNKGKKEGRVKYQKHKLAGILKTFDPALTEYQNMKANGYRRIWDAGNDVYILHTT
jgi:DNA-binding CsgD family transcriptional regulator